MRASATQYLKLKADGTVTGASWDKAFAYIPRICAVNQRSRDKPYLRDLYYIRGMLRKKLSYVREGEMMDILEDAVQSGVAVEDIKIAVRRVGSWTQFRDRMEELEG